MKILLLGDIHFPAANWPALKKIARFNETYQADLVIQMGDLIDAKAWSSYAKHPEDDSPQLEFDKALKDCQKLAKLFPKMVVLVGNHEARVEARVLEARIPKQLVKGIHEVVDIPGWKFHLSDDPFVADNIGFIHGDQGAGTIMQKANKLGMSLCCGHTHKASLTYATTFNKQIFAMEVGCLVEVKNAAFKYASKSLSQSWVGFAVIENGVPILYPL